MSSDAPESPPRLQVSPSTLAVVAGRSPREDGDPICPQPVFASAFHVGGDTSYGRDGNPTWGAFEAALGALEGGSAIAFSSGMAAAAAIIDQLPPGSRVLAGDSAYIEVRKLLERRQRAGLLRVGFVDPRDSAAVIAALPNVDMAWLDLPSNPNLDVPDLEAIGAAPRAEGTLLVVDSTLATPVLVRPLEWGADVVLHSATKFIGGHSDLLLGAAVAGSPAVAERLRETRATLGAVPGTMEAWLALRGLRTLNLRIDRAQRSAGRLAAALERQRGVARVNYPGLVASKSHAIADRLLDGFGAVLSFELEGGASRADQICRRTQLIVHATSLGGVESVIERQGRWHDGPEVAPGLLRLSVGLEDPEDLWADLERALYRGAPAELRPRRERSAKSSPEAANRTPLSSSQRAR